MQLKGKKHLPTTIQLFNLYKLNGCHAAYNYYTCSGARGVVASETLVDAVQQVLGEAVPGTRQHLLEADDGFEAQPAGEETPHGSTPSYSCLARAR